MDEKIIEELLKSGWGMSATWEKLNEVTIIIWHKDWKSSYIPLPTFTGNTVDECFEKLKDYFQ